MIPSAHASRSSISSLDSQSTQDTIADDIQIQGRTTSTDYFTGFDPLDPAPQSFAVPMAGMDLKTPSPGAHIHPNSSTRTPLLVEVPAAPSTLPEGRALRRADFQNPEVVRFFGDALGRLHKTRQSYAHGQEPLYLAEDAQKRIANVAGDAGRRAACKIDVDSAMSLVNILKQDLVSAAAHRIYGDFNLYPEALRIEGDTFTNAPDNPNTGWHADFEVLNRLVYTSRMSSAGLDSMLEAYYASRDHTTVTSDQREAAHKAKYLFDILYYFYFVDIAFATPTVATEASMGREASLAQAALLQSRIVDDAQTLTAASLPQLQFLD